MSAAFQKLVRWLPTSARAPLPLPTEFRFVARGGGYVTPWLSVPDGGLTAAISKLKPAERERLGDGYGCEMRGGRIAPEGAA